MIVNGIDLSDLILIFLSFKIRTLIIGSVAAETIWVCEKQKIYMLIKQILLVVFISNKFIGIVWDCFKIIIY